MNARNTASAALPTLEKLCELAASRMPSRGAYTGEVTSVEAWNFMMQEPAFLVDVRTQPEWQFVGVPDVSGTRGKLLTLSWKHYPAFSVNTQFTDQMKAAGVPKDAPVFFLCRSGGRSHDAAIAMTAEGFRYCFNITDGFEGEPDGQRHRGVATGWKASRLAWMQG